MEKKVNYNSTTTQLQTAKVNYIWRKLDDLPCGTIVEVNDKSNIWVIKAYIDKYQTVEFNPDYTKIKKLNNIL
jgi:hypothetical protein